MRWTAKKSNLKSTTLTNMIKSSSTLAFNTDILSKMMSPQQGIMQWYASFYLLKEILKATRIFSASELMINRSTLISVSNSSVDFTESSLSSSGPDSQQVFSPNNSCIYA